MTIREKSFTINTKDTPSDGIITDMHKVNQNVRNYFIEQKQKCSVYQNGYVTDFINCFTPSGIKLFMYIVLKIPKNADTIELNHQKVGKALKLRSTKTFYNAVSNLEEYDIIKKKEMGVYWVNPHYIFNGSRIQYYRENGGQIVNVNVIDKEL